MKKFKSLKLMLLGVLAMGSMNAFAADGYNKLFKFTYSGNEATITGFNTDLTDADKADVVIPAQVTDVVTGAKKNVVAIADKAFADSKVKSITFTSANLTSIGEEAFKGSQITSLDLSKTKVTQIRNWFGTGYAYIKPSGTAYTATEADKANKSIYNKYSVTAVKKGSKKTTGEEATFTGYEQINEYYKTLNPKAKADGEQIPYTLEEADAKNYTDYSATYSNMVKPGDPVVYSIDDAHAYNNTLEGHLTAGENFTEYTANLFNNAKASMKTKNPGTTDADFPAVVKDQLITEFAANAYNAQLPGAYSVDPANLNPVLGGEDGETPLTYEYGTAYDPSVVNNAILSAAKVAYAKAGDDNPAQAFGSHIDAWKWNNENLIAKADQKKLNDPDPRTVSYYETDEEAHAANITALLAAAAAEGDDLYAKDYDSDEGENLYTTTTTMYSDTPVNGAGKNTKLQSVVLNAYWTTMDDGAFEACEALTSINFGKADSKVTSQSIGERALLGTKLADLNFVGTVVRSISGDAFVYADDPLKGNKKVSPLAPNSNSTLESVEFNKVWTSVDDYTFANCTALATVTFEEREIESESAPGSPATYKVPFTGIGSYAFASTAIAEIEIPMALYPDNVSAIEADAFNGCTSLKSFTYLVDNETDSWSIEAVVDEMAFSGCSGVIYWTSNANYAWYQDWELDAPKNSKMLIKADIAGLETEFDVQPYKNNPSKFYVKYYASKPIKVKKSEATVYNAYRDDDDLTLNMVKYKAKDGYYWIGTGDVVLILTGNKDLQFETGDTWGSAGWSTFGSSSMIDPTSRDYASGENVLNMVTDPDGVSLAQLDSEAGAKKVVYGWVSSATKGTGWMKITSGDTFPQRSLYIFAADEEDGSRLTVNWLDEDGNIEAQTTGINSIFGGAEAADSKAIFNLQGVQVKGAQKGMFIQDGKKYVK